MRSFHERMQVGPKLEGVSSQEPTTTQPQGADTIQRVKASAGFQQDMKRIDNIIDEIWAD